MAKTKKPPADEHPMEILRQNLKGTNKLITKNGIVKKKVLKQFTEHQCEVCNKKFDHKYKLATHSKIHLNEAYECPKCPHVSKTKKYLTRHMKQKHSAPRHKCNVCGRAFHHPSSLREHAMVHTGEKPHKCEVCGKRFRVTFTLRSHMLIHKNEKPYKCSFCDYACRDNSTLRKHESRHMGMFKMYPCKLCSKKYETKSKLKYHISLVHLREPASELNKHSCPQCGKTFQVKANKDKHISIVHGKPKPCACPLCGKKVKHESYLPNHLRSHFPHRPHVCTAPNCGKAFKEKGDLKKHSVIHSPHLHAVCEKCGARFSRPYRLTAHMRTHAPKEKSVICDYCSVSFLTKNYLIKHIKQKHGAERKCYICDHCALVTYNKPSIVMHLKYGQCRKHTLFCRICKTSYKHLNYLRSHYLKTHKMRYRPMKKQMKGKKPKEQLKPKEVEVDASVEVKMEPVDDPYEAVQLAMLTVDKEEVDVEDDGVDGENDLMTYSKQVMSEDLQTYLLTEESAGDRPDSNFDRFLLQHVLHDTVKEEEPEPIEIETDETQVKLVSEQIKVIINTIKEEKVKMKLDKMKKKHEKLLEKKLKREAKIMRKKRRAEKSELEKVREMYNERVKKAAAMAQKKEPPKKITYFHQKTTEIAKTELKADKSEENAITVNDKDNNNHTEDANLTNESNCTENNDENTIITLQNETRNSSNSDTEIIDETTSHETDNYDHTIKNILENDELAKVIDQNCTNVELKAVDKNKVNNTNSNVELINAIKDQTSTGNKYTKSEQNKDSNDNLRKNMNNTAEEFETVKSRNNSETKDTNDNLSEQIDNKTDNVADTVKYSNRHDNKVSNDNLRKDINNETEEVDSAQDRKKIENKSSILDMNNKINSKIDDQDDTVSDNCENKHSNGNSSKDQDNVTNNEIDTMKDSNSNNSEVVKLEETGDTNRSVRSSARVKKSKSNYMGDYNTDDDDDKSDAQSLYDPKSDEESVPNKKLKFITHQCYVCFKLFSTKEDLLSHCETHYDICNKTTLSKCPICGHVANKGIATHMREKHDVNIKIPHMDITTREDGQGSKYCYKTANTVLEIIPSVKILNHSASVAIDRRNRARRDMAIETTKLVRRGESWVVEKQPAHVDYVEMPEFTDAELDKLPFSSDYVERLGHLSRLARRRGVRIVFPCMSCEKICQSLCALKLHCRRHDPDKKPFAKKQYKRDAEPAAAVPTKQVKNITNRTAKPKPIKNKHRCEEELKKFYETHIRGADIEFWQFLKIYNKMDRDNVQDFADLEGNPDFGARIYGENPESESAPEAKTNLEFRQNQIQGENSANMSDAGLNSKSKKRVFSATECEPNYDSNRDENPTKNPKYNKANKSKSHVLGLGNRTKDNTSNIHTNELSKTVQPKVSQIRNTSNVRKSKFKVDLLHKTVPRSVSSKTVQPDKKPYKRVILISKRLHLEREKAKMILREKVKENFKG